MRLPLAMVWSGFFEVANVVLAGVCYCAVYGGVDGCTMCVAFVAQVMLVLIVCEGLFEFVVLLSAVSLLLTLSLVVLALLFLSQGSL